jgi:hypothetical protein
MLLTLLMLLGLCGGFWLWNRIRAANAELKRVNQALSSDFGPDTCVCCPDGKDILAPWLTPTLLTALLVLGICTNFVLFPPETAAEAHVLARSQADLSNAEVLTAEVVFDPSAAVEVPDQVFPPPAITLPAPPVRCSPLSLARARQLARHTGRSIGVSSGLLLAVIYQESRFFPCAISSSGALGLMQLKPETALEHGVTDVFDPAQNIIGGARYLRFLLDRYSGDVPTALSAYLTGPGTVERMSNGESPAGAREYVDSVMDLAEVLSDD